MTNALPCHYEQELYMSAPDIVLPEKRYSNAEIVARIRQNFAGSEREWQKIERRLSYVFAMFGSEYRYLEDAEPRSLASYAAKTIRSCLSSQQRDAGDVDAVLYAGVCKEYLEPATAVQVAAAVGIMNPAVALDISAACAGVLNAIIIFGALANSDPGLTTGVVSSIEGTGRSADNLGGICYDIQSAADLMSRAAGLTIGNAGGALLVSRRKPVRGARIVASLTETFAEHHDLSKVHVNGSFECDAFGLFREWRLFPAHIRKLGESLGWSADDVAYFCVHQPSEKLVEKVSGFFGVPLDKVPRIHAAYGNTVTLSPIMALDSLLQEGRINPGDRLIISAAGSGITLTSIAIEWLH